MQSFVLFCCCCCCCCYCCCCWWWWWFCFFVLFFFCFFVTVCLFHFHIHYPFSSNSINCFRVSIYGNRVYFAIRKQQWYGLWTLWLWQTRTNQCGFIKKTMGHPNIMYNSVCQRLDSAQKKTHERAPEARESAGGERRAPKARVFRRRRRDSAKWQETNSQFLALNSCKAHTSWISCSYLVCDTDYMYKGDDDVFIPFILSPSIGIN